MMTKAWRERPQSIEIPVRESNEVVEVFLDELPNDPSEIRAILYAEGAPIELFLHFAIEYYYQGKFEEFRYLIKEGLAECRRRGERKSEVTLHTALAAFHIALGLHLLPTDRPEATLFEEATVNLNDAERNGASEVCLLLRKGLLLLAQRKLTQAEYTLKTVLNREPENVAAHVALVYLVILILK
jgi:RNA polymerase-associated protein CTR9